MPKGFPSLVAAFVALSAPWSVTKAAAQSYPIDCAILLCLSGGWPASAHCARARAEFIRRITPWPIEPPLQIWRCPMGVTYFQNGTKGAGVRLFDAALGQLADLPASQGPGSFPPKFSPKAIPGTAGKWPWRRRDDTALQLAQSADIDISGPEFDFVRSIRVYDVRYARQYNAGSEGGCMHSALIFLGTYSVQGAFSWKRSVPEDLPAAHVGLEAWGTICPTIYHRSVFVDWTDFTGNYGFEQVDY